MSRRRPEGVAHPPAHERALGRIATLVAEGASPEAVYSALAEEVATLLAVPSVTLGRYGPDRTFTVLAAPSVLGFQPGTRWRLDGPSIAATVLDTGRPARIDDYSNAPGQLAQIARAASMRSASGVPITLDGAIWGLFAAGGTDEQPLPPDTEERLGGFTELVTLALAHAESQ